MIASFMAEERRDLLRQARELLRAVDAKELRAKVRDRSERFPWLVAIPVHTLSQPFSPPLPPADFSVIASDGSSIPPDRHSPLRYYVINTGHAVLTYGSYPNADLDSEGQLCFEDGDLYVSPGQKNIPIEGARLGVKMQIAELQAALRAIQAATDPMVVLRDGSLILWPLQNEEKDVKEEFLGQFLKCLDGFRAVSVPVVGYISYTGSHDVANALRVSLCRDDPSDCEHCSLAGEQRGEQDDRNLWPEMRRVIAELRPRWVLAENVPGIRNVYLDTVLSDLEGLDYTAGTLDLPAVAFGAPHVRHRLFIVAHANEQGLPFRQRQPGMDSTAQQGHAGQNVALQGWWATEPNVGRVANGIPHRVDRLRALGNAVVPQVAEWIGCRIVEIDFG